MSLFYIFCSVLNLDNLCAEKCVLEMATKPLTGPVLDCCSAEAEESLSAVVPQYTLHNMYAGDCS